MFFSLIIEIIEIVMSKMMVCNCKVKYLRSGEYGKTYDNIREFMDDEENIYIGRHGRVPIANEGVFPYKASIWANIYTIGPNGDRDEVLCKYKRYIIKKIVNEKLYEELDELNDKRLGCWCKPEACHGDVLVHILKYYNKYGRKWLKEKKRGYEEED